MGMQVCMGGVMMCTFGAAPSSIVPTPKPIMTSNMVAAIIMDHVPRANIPPFGACMSLANPTVAAATAAALGVLTPMPCIPPRQRLGCRVRRRSYCRTSRRSMRRRS